VIEVTNYQIGVLTVTEPVIGTLVDIIYHTVTDQNIVCPVLRGTPKLETQIIKCAHV
jgi:hypothetical protein